MPSESTINPHLRLRNYIEVELNNFKIKNPLKLELLEEIPKRWEKLGDLVLFPELSFTSENWMKIISINQNVIWHSLAKALQVSKIGRQKRIQLGPMRRSQVELLYGKDGIVLHKENGIFFEFDVTKVMFSSGNISERIRVSKFDCSDEIILDLYAGIGYYTLPLLVYTKAKLLHACEFNSDSITELEKNLVHNDVFEKCIIHEGDNNETILNSNFLGKINRVILGLLPSSEKSWHLAIQALDSNGGMLHLHGNTTAKKEKEWAETVIEKLNQISDNFNRGFQFKLEHIEKVKSYAPKVNHVVLDIKVFK